MALVHLINVPKNQIDWEFYGFNNKEQINLIREAIKERDDVNLPEYQLYPINFTFFQQWLENKQAAHTDFNAELGLQGSDLKVLDIKNEKQLQSWIHIQYQELFSASAALGI